MGVPAECLLDAAHVPLELCCPVCHELVYPRSGLQTPCGHIFCAACITASLRFNGQCPEDRKPLIDADLRSLRDGNPLIYRMLGRTAVRCPNYEKDCSWTGELSEFASHNTTCQKELVPCDTCNRKIAREEVEAHRFSCSLEHCEECLEKDAELLEYRRELVHCRARLAECRLELEELRVREAELAGLHQLQLRALSLAETGQLISRSLRSKPVEVDSAQLLQILRSAFDSWQRAPVRCPPTKDITDELLYALSAAMLAKEWFSDNQRCSIRKMLLKICSRHCQISPQLSSDSTLAAGWPTLSPTNLFWH